MDNQDLIDLVQEQWYNNVSQKETHQAVQKDLPYLTVSSVQVKQLCQKLGLPLARTTPMTDKEEYANREAIWKVIEEHRG